jgi:peptidoglycan-associated lipoprotein
MRSSHVLSAAVLLTFAATGCRSHKQTAAVPAVVPPQAVTAPAPKPAETSVAATTNDFQPPKQQVDDLGSDPAQATQIAEQKGWIRDAFFDFDSTVIPAPSQQNLQVSAKWLEAHPRVHVLIEGHCDERGTERYNLALGDRRAYEAKEYLAVLGVNADDVRTISYGKEKPFDTGHDESAWSKNRRAHLVLTALK